MEDIDTSSLVYDDELNQQYQQHERQRQSNAEELPHILEESTSSQVNNGGDVINRDQFRTGNRGNNRRLYSTERYYDSTNTENIRQQHCLSQHKISQSRHLPAWIWRILTVILGIPPASRRLAAVLYIITLLSALGFTFFGIIFVVFDISSKNTRTTAHIGFISLVIGFGWLGLGIYSFRLAGRLLGDPDFATSVRLHSRTLFKISTAMLLIICGVAFTSLNLYTDFSMFTLGHCSNIGLWPELCPILYVFRAVFSIIGTVWNLIVGCTLLSVCRTHTIGIRRFIRDLEEDSRRYEDFWREKLRLAPAGEYNRDTASILNNSDWFVLDDTSNMGRSNYLESTDRAYTVSTATSLSPRHSRLQGTNHRIPDTSQSVLGTSVPTDNNSSVFLATGEATQGISHGDNFQRPPVLQTSASMDSGCLPEDAPIMSPDELLLWYWKISNRMRLTSRCLQRWLASWTAFVVVWCADYVIYWLSHPPNILGILQFLAPVLLLFILCLAYAEANGEGQNMIRCICPTKERYGLLSFLHLQPLQMQVFNLSISYNAILTVLLAFSVAFSSRLVLDEVVKH